MELHADEPRMIAKLDDLGQVAVDRRASDDQALVLERLTKLIVEFVTMTVALDDGVFFIQLAHMTAGDQATFLSTQTHAAADVAADRTFLLAAFGRDPLRHHGNDRVRRLRIELGAVRALEAGDVARVLDHRHLHAEADTEIGDAARARKVDRFDLALDAALAEAARYQNRV